MKSFSFLATTTLVFATTIAACKGGTTTGDSPATSDGGLPTTATKATPQAIFDGRLESGVGTDCKEVGALFTVGDFGNPATTPAAPSKSVKDGESGVGIACSVVKTGTDAFTVSAVLDQSGDSGGSFRIDGSFKGFGEQTDIHAVFTSRKTTTSFEQSGCVARYETSFQGVAEGRVWGVVTCPKATNNTAATSCAAIAQFRFENCAQQ